MATIASTITKHCTTSARMFGGCPISGPWPTIVMASMTELTVIVCQTVVRTSAHSAVAMLTGTSRKSRTSSPSPTTRR
jgi:hypothetical protein